MQFVATGRQSFALGHDSRPWIDLASCAALHRYCEDQLVLNNPMAYAGACALVGGFPVNKDADLPTAVRLYVAIAQAGPFSLLRKQLDFQVKRFLLFPFPPYPVARLTQLVLGTVARPLK